MVSIVLGDALGLRFVLRGTFVLLVLIEFFPLAPLAISKVLALIGGRRLLTIFLLLLLVVLQALSFVLLMLVQRVRVLGLAFCLSRRSCKWKHRKQDKKH